MLEVELTVALAEEDVIEDAEAGVLDDSVTVLLVLIDELTDSTELVDEVA